MYWSKIREEVVGLSYVDIVQRFTRNEVQYVGRFDFLHGIPRVPRHCLDVVLDNRIEKQWTRALHYILSCRAVLTFVETVQNQF